MDELDEVLSYGLTENPSDRAFELARDLFGRFMLQCREKDESENDTFFTDICMRHNKFLTETVAKCYQTMLDKGVVE